MAWYSGIYDHLFGSSAGIFTNPIGAWDRFKNGESTDVARETNEQNKAIADENLQFQQEQFDYQKALQQQIFEREDTAYQRTVNDMRAAGLSPQSMQSTNGAGEAIATTAPQNGYHAQAYQSMGDLQAVSQVFSMLTGLSNASAASDVSQAQAENIEEDTNTKKIDNLTRGFRNVAELRKLGLDSEAQELMNALNKQLFDFNDKANVLRLTGLDLDNIGKTNANALSKQQYNYNESANPFLLAGLGLSNQGQKLNLKSMRLQNKLSQQQFDWNENTYDGRRNALMNQSLISDYMLSDAMREDKFNERYKINKGMTPQERAAALMAYQMFSSGDPYENISKFLFTQGMASGLGNFFTDLIGAFSGAGAGSSRGRR